MQSDLLRPLKKNGDHLTGGEKIQLLEARALQREIITVDSFSHDDYFSKTTTGQKT